MLEFNIIMYFDCETNGVACCFIASDRAISHIDPVDATAE